MHNYPRKLAISEWNTMLFHSLKLMFSVSGLLMFAVIIGFGGGAISLIMGQVTMQGLGYFIIQPAVFAIYFVCLLARYRSGNASLPIGKEFRNVILNVLMGVAVTILLLLLLWSIRIYIPTASAADVQPAITNAPVGLSPQPFKATPVSFGSVFPVMFNIFSIATFSVLAFVPFVAVIIAALVNVNAPLHRNLGLLFRGLHRNIGTMVVFSIFTVCLMALWSYMAVKSEYLIFLSALPLAYLSVFSYVIAEQIYMPEKCLFKRGSVKGVNPHTRF
ncbi:hypothetical protein [Klebsiella sp. HN106]|uniref:hypothetical protein n=1 Tax=Klebsiella sp. HN106 TaxID=3401058 RepID=UPI003EB7CE0E